MITFDTHENNISNSKPEPDAIPIKAYCKKDLLHLYDISYKTLTKWLKPIKEILGPLHGRYYNLIQVRIIVSHFGAPGQKKKKNKTA